MLMATLRIWLFVVVAVFVARSAVSSKKVYGTDSQTKWQRADRRWLFGGAPGSEFFAGGKRPEGLPQAAIDGEEILQTLPGDPPDTYYFVSLFDKVQNTAFYSAYRVTPAQAAQLRTFTRGQVSGRWRTPGVPGLDGAYREAINTDREPLSRGHMNPVVMNSFNKRFMEATFTLSNTVPQFVESNGGPWASFENRIAHYANNICRTKGGTLYLLTGKSSVGLTIDASDKPVQDVAMPLPYIRENFPGPGGVAGGVKLVTPRAVWTAGCCVWTEPGRVFGKLWPAKKAESFAVMSNNQEDKNLLHQTEMSVSTLETLLADPISQQVNLFPGNGNCRLKGNYKKI